MTQQRSDLGLPAWLIFLRIAQGALALLILILSAVAASKYLGGADPTYLVSQTLMGANDGTVWKQRSDMITRVK